MNNNYYFMIFSFFIEIAFLFKLIIDQWFVFLLLTNVLEHHFGNVVPKCVT